MGGRSQGGAVMTNLSLSRSQLCHRQRELAAQRSALRKRQVAISAEIKSVNRAISMMDAEPVMVSDHAVVRWLERVLLVDIEAVRKEIARLAAPHVGSRKTVTAAPGIELLIDGHMVVTAMPDKPKKVE